MDRTKINELVRLERAFQDKKWGRSAGEWDDPVDTKLRILAEEFGEVARAINDTDYENLRDELVQVMAVCCAWLESDY